MNSTDILLAAETFVRKELEKEYSGHGWWHVVRVRNTARELAHAEIRAGREIDVYLVELTALMHDVGDPKLHSGDETAARRIITQWSQEVGLEKEMMEKVLYIVEHMSFSKTLTKSSFERSHEFKIVQDADRLDAIGAIGIARTFSYGGNKHRPMYNPERPPTENLTKEQYYSGEGHTIAHFYEKLLKLKDMMNTQSAKDMAEGRHEFMKQFLDQFYAEWDGKK